MSAPIISLIDLTKQYGDHTAVDRLNLHIMRGEVFGLLGPNGAGKSTTILMMLGLTEPTSGKALVCGLNATRRPMEVKQKVGYLPDDVGFYDELTGYENLMYVARLNRIPTDVANKRITTLLERVGLSHAADQKTGTYSRGMRQRLGLADVLIKQPEVIILDEPTLGIDPEGVKELLDLIQRLSREEDITVLISSHHLHQMQQICDRVGLFVNGKLLAEGEIDELAAKLFASEPITIELDFRADNKIVLVDAIKALPEVISVNSTDDYYSIDCKADVSDMLSRLVYEQGATITHLNRRQVGLDDIYHRYFEGGVSDASYSETETADAITQQ